MRKVTTAAAGEHLLISFELGLEKWKLGFAKDLSSSRRVREVAARDQTAVKAEIAKARQALGLSATAPVISCYEAGRDGFWLHRWLTHEGITNHVVDSASIEVNRRQRRAKTDRLDAHKLVTMLARYVSGERDLWSVVRVPSVADEDGRHLHRGLTTLKQERTSLINRIKGLVMGQGVHIPRRVDQPGFLPWLEAVRLWDGQPLPPGLQARVRQEHERLLVVATQILAREGTQRRELREASAETAKAPAPAAVTAPTSTAATMQKVVRLVMLRGIGRSSAWKLGHEVFGWRQFSNRREVGGLLGFTPTPYESGDRRREQGISKAGNGVLKGMMVELAWGWLRYQPQSALSQWYERRFAHGGPRLRKIGIVALGRKLLIALWRYVEFGVIPEEAVLKAEAA